MPQPKRSTIADLAKAAGVSVSTVNRILSGAKGVRPATIKRVEDAAARIDFYGRGLIAHRARNALPSYRFGFLLQQRSRELYHHFGIHIQNAARRCANANIDAVVDYAEDLSPEKIADQLHALGKTCDAVTVIAADHPLIGHAIRDLKDQGKPVITYITDLSAPDRAGHVGTDNWKLGRTAAWFIVKTTSGPGRVAVFIGNHRYQCQDVSDASFRSYIREHAPWLTIDDSRPTHEDPALACNMTRELLNAEPDLVGIYVAGGGISGVLTALRDLPPDRLARISVVCRDIGPETRKGLSEGLITAALCHPLETISSQLVDAMIEAKENGESTSIIQRIVPFEIITPESL